MNKDIETIKELKEAGFPQKTDLFRTDGVYVSTSGIVKDDDKIIKEMVETGQAWYMPTLEELIEACGLRIFSLTKNDDYWSANGKQGETPTEAVAKLWINLNQ